MVYLGSYSHDTDVMGFAPEVWYETKSWICSVDPFLNPCCFLSASPLPRNLQAN